MQIAIMISSSGTGTNLKAIIGGVKTGTIRAEICAVLSDRSDAPALKYAREQDINIEICSKKKELLPLLSRLNPDYVCLAGWKQIIPEEIIAKYKILNLHPGLVPNSMSGVVKNPDATKALWNKGLYAEKAIGNFLKNKATYAGSSIHFLTKEFDFGPVLGRTFEKIKIDDTVESLYVRLKMKENKLYVEVLEKLTNAK